ncbi:MAG: hypothetical protein KDE27_29690 [Planctomycetes bacterium]|nr:hypothetical protein [Planctomycetota bacterium]
MKLKIAAFLFLAAVARADTLPDWHDGFGAPPAGLGLNGDPRALLAHDGSLYCGGSFNQAGPVTSWFLARLDRVNSSFAWTSLGDLDNRVNALTAWGDSVLAGGRFTLVDGVDADRVAVWDGAAWHAVGDPAAWTWGHVSALAVIDGAPWAAGTGFVVRWNGSAWISMTGSGFTGDVFALAAYDGAPVMGGAFASVPNPADDPTAAANVARWDGAMWHALGAGVDQEVNALTLLPNGDLAVGGDFTTAGGQPASHVALWDGAAWTTLPPGADGDVFALGVLPNGTLAVGGNFGQIGGVVCPALGYYGTSCQVQRIAHGCGSATIDATGNGALGTAVVTTVSNATGPTFVGYGFVGSTALCSACTLGHDWSTAVFASSHTLAIPNVPAFAGLPIGVQAGELFAAPGCVVPAPVALTDTLVVTVH